MVPAPNRTPRLITSSSEQRPGSCRGRTKPVPAKGQLGSREEGTASPSRSTALSQPSSPSEGRSHGYPCIFSALKETLHSERKQEAGHSRAGLPRLEKTFLEGTTKGRRRH